MYFIFNIARKPKYSLDWKIRCHARVKNSAISSPSDISDCHTRSLIDFRIEAVLMGRFYFYQQPGYFSKNELQGVPLDQLTTICATTDPKFVQFVNSYRETPCTGSDHEYTVPEADVYGWDGSTNTNPWNSAIFHRDSFGYCLRGNSVCYWNQSGSEIFCDHGFKLVPISQTTAIYKPRRTPDLSIFMTIPANQCLSKIMSIDERGFWSTMIWYGYLGSFGCASWDKVMDRMHEQVSTRGGYMYHCDQCHLREPQPLYFCSNCKHAKYCGRQCQKKSYKLHKLMCVSPSAAT